MISLDNLHFREKQSTATPPPVPPRPDKELVRERLLNLETKTHSNTQEPLDEKRRSSGIVIDYSKFRRPPRIIGDANDEISFSCPSGVAVSKTGLIYVADQQNQCVKMIPLLGSEKQILSRPFNRPKGVHVDELGRVLVTENNRLLILDHELNLLKTIGDHGSKPGEFNIPWGKMTSREEEEDRKD